MRDDRNDKRTRTPEIDPDAPASEEELAASKRLRDALEDPSIADPDADLARSLRAAFAPTPLAPDEHASMLEDVPTADELAVAAELRDGFDADPLVVALRAAWSPAPIGEDEHRAIVARVMGPARAEVVTLRPRGRVVRVAFGVVAGTLALAASVVVYVNASPSGEQPLARARSTQPLFAEPFKTGDASARIDTIAMARASDFRDNRFARWGVR